MEDNYFDANHLRFALGNVGEGIIVVTRLWIEVIDSAPCTDSFSVGPGAQLMEHEYEVLLSPGTHAYTVEDRKIFTYSPGEIEGFRVTMKSSGHYRYKIRLNVEWHSAGEERRGVLQSPIYDIRYPYVNDFFSERLFFRRREKVVRITPLLVDGKPNSRLLNIFMFPEHWEHSNLLHVLCHAQPRTVLGEYVSSVESRALDKDIVPEHRIGYLTALAHLIDYDKSALGVFMDRPQERLGELYDKIHRIIRERFMDTSEDARLRRAAVELLYNYHYFSEKRSLMFGFVQYQPRLDVQWLSERLVVLRATLLSEEPRVIELGLRILNGDGYNGALAWIQKETEHPKSTELVDSIDSLLPRLLLEWEDIRVLRPALEYCRRRKIVAALPRVNELAQSQLVGVAKIAQSIARLLSR